MNINEDLNEAIKIYLNGGGVVKVEDKQPLRIIYPTKSKIKEMIDDTVETRKSIEAQSSHWKNEMKRVTSESFTTNVSKAANPIYWQHLLQMASSAEYRKAFETVEPPMQMMNTPRYRKVIEMFVKSPEYRERLIEARTSILGKMRESIGETAKRSDNFRKDTIETRMQKLKKEKDANEERASALKIIYSSSDRFF